MLHGEGDEERGRRGYTRAGRGSLVFDGAIAVGDALLEGAAAGDHGQHVLDVGDHDVQQVGPRRVEHLADGGPQLAGVEDAARRDAKGLGHGDEIGEDVLGVLGLLVL